MDCQHRKRIANVVANHFGCNDPARASIPRVDMPFQESQLFEAPHDDRNGAVRKSDLAAELLQAQAARTHQGVHDIPLRTGQATPRDLGLERLPQDATHCLKMLVDLLRKALEPEARAGRGLRRWMAGHMRKGMSAFTSCL